MPIELSKAMRESISDVLLFLKKNYRYKDLCEVTGLPITVLCRYAMKYVMPSRDRAIKLHEALSPLVNKQLRHIINGKNIDVLYAPSTLKLIASKILFDVVGTRVTKILAFDDVAPLAVALSLKLDRPFVLILSHKSNVYEDYFETRVKINGFIVRYYVPLYAISIKDKLLFIDFELDSIKNDVLSQIISNTGAEIVSKYIISERLM